MPVRMSFDATAPESNVPAARHRSAERPARDIVDRSRSFEQRGGPGPIGAARNSEPMRSDRTRAEPMPIDRLDRSVRSANAGRSPWWRSSLSGRAHPAPGTGRANVSLDPGDLQSRQIYSSDPDRTRGRGDGSRVAASHASMSAPVRFLYPIGDPALHVAESVAQVSACFEAGGSLSAVTPCVEGGYRYSEVSGQFCGCE